MRLVYLASAARDLLWLRHYYDRVLPEGAAGARARIQATERLILGNPHIGRRTHRAGLRRLPIARTPFFIVHRATDERIEILRVVDGRAFDSQLED